MEEKKEQEKQLEICPCCGKPTLLSDKIHISNLVIDHYLACIITGEPFSKDYYLYNGKMKVRVMSLSDEILDTMSLLTSKFTFIKLLNIKDTYKLFVSRLFTFLPIVSISIIKEGHLEIKDIRAVTLPLLKEAVLHIKDLSWLAKAYKILLDPTMVFSVPKNTLNDIVAEHLKVLRFLEAQSASKNFFLGIVQV